MAMDMDIDMGLDLDTGDDFIISPAQPLHITSQAASISNDPMAIMEDVEDTEPTPTKVHLRGLDELTSSDLRDFASQYYSSKLFDRIEWINDTSANLVYADSETALEALKYFSAVEISTSSLSVMDMLPAKPFPAHPNIVIKVRQAVAGDRKQAGARERSRFYLFNPEHDRQERRRRDDSSRAGPKYRDRDDGGYRSQIFDKREGQRRMNDERFDASLYDDDEKALAARASAQRSRRESTSSLSSQDHRGQGIRRVRFSRAEGKELFPHKVVQRNGGRLRDRSASPIRESEEGDTTAERRSAGRQGINDSDTANRLKARMMKTRLRESAAAPIPPELFPHKLGINHKRSDAFDAADVTADLFADRMSFVDGSGDIPSNGRDLDSRIMQDSIWDETRINDRPAMNEGIGFRIRGTSRKPDTGFSIKGQAASGSITKELFPLKSAPNAGKELFGDNLKGRGGKRQRAEDMFS